MFFNLGFYLGENIADARLVLKKEKYLASFTIAICLPFLLVLFLFLFVGAKYESHLLRLVVC